MLKKLLLTMACCMAMCISYAQSTNNESNTPENITSHRVAMGETVALLAKKYKMTPQDIYEYNPDATEGINPGAILQIPLHRQVDLSTPQPKKEKVAYVQSKQKKQPGATADHPEAEPLQAVSADDDTAPENTDTPIAETVAVAAATQQETLPSATATISGPVKHTVEKGETLYGLSQKYGVSIEVLKEQNPLLKHGLQTGQTLTINATTNTATIATAVTAQSYTSHTVQSGETLFGLSKKYGVSVGQITDANKKTLKNGLQTGQTLKIPAATQDSPTVMTEDIQH
jgi:LysM repeat protein